MTDERVWTPARHPLARLLRDIAAGRFRDTDGGWTRVSPWAPHLQAIVTFTGHAILAVSYDVPDIGLAKLGVDGVGGAHHPSVVTALAGANGWIDQLQILLLGIGTGCDGHQSLVSRSDLAKRPFVDHVLRTCQNLQVMGSRDHLDRDVVVLSRGVAGLRQVSVDCTQSTCVEGRPPRSSTKHAPASRSTNSWLRACRRATRSHSGQLWPAGSAPLARFSCSARAQNAPCTPLVLPRLERLALRAVPNARLSTTAAPAKRAAAAQGCVRSRMTRPVRSFGMKNVDFGGMSRPSRAVRSISVMLTGLISTAACAAPVSSACITSSTPCW